MGGVLFSYTSVLRVNFGWVALYVGWLALCRETGKRVGLRKKALDRTKDRDRGIKWGNLANIIVGLASCEDPS